MEILLLTTLLYLFGGTLSNYAPHLTKGHGTIGQLYDALNTTDVIWLLQRTYTIKENRCVYAVKVSLDNFNYEFNQFYLENEKLKREHLYASLSSIAEGQFQGAEMTVKQKKEDPNGIKYRLIHYEEKHHCAIIDFEVEQDGRKTTQCEAHIWDRDVNTGYEACLGFYDQYCDYYGRHINTKQVVYSKDCQVDPGC